MRNGERNRRSPFDFAQGRLSTTLRRSVVESLRFFPRYPRDQKPPVLAIRREFVSWSESRSAVLERDLASREQLTRSQSGERNRFRLALRVHSADMEVYP